MIKLFSNKELADRLCINPARWKRWSREFLPPDPLAGLQSGYARQYYLNDAFIVHLGGHLVSSLRMSIPEARRILGDLGDWLRENGYRFDPAGQPAAVDPSALPVSAHKVTVYPDGAGGFVYRVKALIRRERDNADGHTVWREVFAEKWLPPDAKSVPELQSPKIIAISLILEKFLTAVDPKGHQFPMLHRNGTKVVSRIDQPNIV